VNTNALPSTWTRPQRAKNAILFSLAGFALRCLDALPVQTTRALCTFASFIAFRIPSLRARVLRNLLVAFPSLTVSELATLAHRNQQHIARLAFDLLTELRSNKPDNAEAVPLPISLSQHARDVLERLVASKRGVVLVSLHLGNWEQVAQCLHRAGIPLSVLVKGPYDPRFGGLFTKLRGALPSIDRDHPHAGLTMLRVLRRGHVLGVPMDLKTRSLSMTIPLFGKAARTAVGAARLALRTSAHVVVVSMGPANEVTLDEMQTEDLSRSGETELLRRIHKSFEARIRALPHAWLWLHERWDAP
jgi:Kdo2-lipid IVA lauroyltransferase/acyltransferase